MLICSKCGTENNDGEMFCRECGAELYSGDNVSSDKPEKITDKDKNKDKKKKPFAKGKKTDKDSDNNPENNASDKKKKGLTRSQKMKIIVAVIAFALVIVLFFLITNLVTASKGENIASKVPLGRNIDYCIKETGAEFNSSSAYTAMRSVSSFNYICESDKSVNIDGITVPTWAVMVNEDSSGILESVEYYNFNLLKGGWKGEHSLVRLTKDSVTYGMDEKSVAKALGFDPYYIKKTNDDTQISCYRYYIVDNETGSERVFNYFVEYNDVNGTVVNAYDTEINYINYVLGIK